jgi:hypothetical protein
MPTATIVPASLSDTNSNVAAGAYTDIDETIAAADGSTLDSVTNQWTNGPGTASAFTFTLTDLPAAALSINTVQFRVRARVTPTGAVDDIVSWVCDVQGSNAPTTTANFTSADEGAGFANRGASTGVTSSALVSEVNSWTIRVYQSAYSPESTADGLNLEIDCIEIIVDYNESGAGGPGGGAGGGNYVVIPTTDTSIYGLCITQARDFVVLGGMDTDRYSIRWSALGDVTDWPVPATDDARSKQSGTQSFPTKYGWVTALAGDDFSMLVFQETAVHRATYVGGDIVWSFETIDESRGCVRQGRMAKADDLVFFQSKFGFHVAKGATITDIGYGIVDDTFN